MDGLSRAQINRQSPKCVDSAIEARRVPRPEREPRAVILSVDDELTLLQVREKLLQFAGYEVLSAADGEKALEVFAAHRVDLVLLDFYMPRMNGGIVAQQMKRCKPAVPVVMVSANDLQEEALRCVDGFIVKGQRPDVLLRMIKTFLPSNSRTDSH
jgi:two-component system alkaline phosphatase synthesis response regulator PhoP